MLNVVVTMKPKPGHIAEFEKSLGELLAIVREEPGCVGVSWGSIEGRDTYAVIETYLDHAARDEHLRSAALAQYGPTVAELLDEAPTSVVFTSV
ncbi:putative quinol monooxygenase [Mycolicibacterium sp. 22603]|uniref:putative quinol monooxygenase n=1 Tax=Mycolicibacterium sp. 22603 TaxID=3453950 RepID=UPI003F84FC92